MTILAIESSCDDTGAAALAALDNACSKTLVASPKRFMNSTEELYWTLCLRIYKTLFRWLDAVLKKVWRAVMTFDAITFFTQAPGLIGSLLVGAQFAKSLATSLKTLISVHHMW